MPQTTKKSNNAHSLLILITTIQLKTVNVIINWVERGKKILCFHIKGFNLAKIPIFLVLCSIQGPNNGKFHIWYCQTTVFISRRHILCNQLKKNHRILHFFDEKWPKTQKSQKMLIQGPKNGISLLNSGPQKLILTD